MDSSFYDVIIIGGGPAGLTAALYLARARYRVLVMEKERFGGQITISAEVVNYPGVKCGSGEEITSVMRSQAQSFGAEFLLAEARKVDLAGETKLVQSTRGEFRAFGAILATGAHPRSIGFEGEEKFKGKGVAYCATCDGEFYTGLEVFVIGGGYAAAEEAVFLAKYARHVTVLIRGGTFSCAKATADEVINHEKISVLYNTEVVSISGDETPQLLRYHNRKTDETGEFHAPEGETFGVFVFAGYAPDTNLVKGQIDLDEQGYILSDGNGKTNLEGVYAAGDVRIKDLRQMVTATSDGAIAATQLEHYVAAMQEQTGIIPEQPATRVNQKKDVYSPEVDTSGFFSDDILAQLGGVFEKMAAPLLLKVYLDDKPVSRELQGFVQELVGTTNKVSAEFIQKDVPEGVAPCIAIYKQDGTDTGLAFHGVPGGHEFNSFIVGLFNAAGPGQTLDNDVLERIKAFKKPIDMKMLISLSCSMCPELVMAAQRMAAENPLVRAEAYDLNHFPELQEKYKVMSVPVLVVNDEIVSIGKMNLVQLLDFLENADLK